MSARPSLRVHRPTLLMRCDGRFEVQCEDCFSRFDEAPPIGIGIPVANEHEAKKMLRNHVGRAAGATAPHALPVTQPHRQSVGVRRTA
jgi:hypothetical protein